MSINYAINAMVFNLRNYDPQPSDKFFVDTNVWYWTTYPNASLEAEPYQTSEYPAFMKKAIANGSSLFHVGLSLSELANIIEAIEYRQFLRKNPNYKTTIKEFRYNYSPERARVTKIVSTAWQQVKQYSRSLDMLVNDGLTDRALMRFQTKPLNGYDLFIVETLNNARLPNIITDDADFSTILGLNVFTANPNVIETARRQKHLTRPKQ